MPHIDALHDMIRMLKPGGVLVLTYDFFLNDKLNWRGWDFLADIQMLELSGVPLLTRKRLLRSRTYIYNYEDTLFMTPEAILSFEDRYFRSTSIGMMFRKPGVGEGKVRLAPNPALKDVLFPWSETSEDVPEIAAEPFVPDLMTIARRLRRQFRRIGSPRPGRDK
jgi:hypothetical protein